MLSVTVLILVILSLGFAGLLTVAQAFTAKQPSILVWLIPHAVALTFCLAFLHDVTGWNWWAMSLAALLGCFIYPILAVAILAQLVFFIFKPRKKK